METFGGGEYEARALKNTSELWLRSGKKGWFNHSNFVVSHMKLDSDKILGTSCLHLHTTCPVFSFSGTHFLSLKL